MADLDRFGVPDGLGLLGPTAARCPSVALARRWPRPDRGGDVRPAATGWFSQPWVAHVLDQGVAAGTVQVSGSPLETARMIVAGVEGAMLVAYPFCDYERFSAAASRLLASLAAPAR
jgi:hypothetical protein